MLDTFEFMKFISMPIDEIQSSVTHAFRESNKTLGGPRWEDPFLPATGNNHSEVHT